MDKTVDINPDEFETFPTEMVAAVLPADTDPATVQQRLVEAGISGERVSFLVGRGGLEALDPTGEDHGFFARLKRSFESVSMEGPALDAAVDALKADKTIISVTDTPDDDADTVRQHLIDQGALETFHFGRWTFTQSGPIVGADELPA